VTKVDDSFVKTGFPVNCPRSPSGRENLPIEMRLSRHSRRITSELNPRSPAWRSLPEVSPLGELFAYSVEDIFFLFYDVSEDSRASRSCRARANGGTT